MSFSTDANRRAQKKESCGENRLSRRTPRKKELWHFKEENLTLSQNLG